MELEEYIFAGSCSGHNTKFVVRSVAALPENHFASASSDRHGKSVGGVGALSFIPGGVLNHSPEFKDGVLVSAGYDHKIALWGSNAFMGITRDPSPSRYLAGHGNGVIALATSEDGLILSGSLDNTAALWDPRQSPPRIAKFVGHQYPVWGVVFLDNGDVATGSGDRTIKVWNRNGKLKQTIEGEHGDTIRHLCNIPGLGFLSTCNDYAVRLFTYDGTLIHRLEGHENFSFSAIQLNADEFATAGDDAVRIWRDFNNIQTMRHPTGIWQIVKLQNGDIVAAGQDGVVYVWTKNSDRKAAETATGVFYSSVEIYLQQLQEAKQPKKETLDGVEYDVVIPVEVEGYEPLRLGYNLTDNPYTVAQQFCITYQLNPVTYKEAIAQHIVKVTKHMQPAGGPAYSTAQPSSQQPKSQADKFFLKHENVVLFDKGINLQACEAKIVELSKALEAAEATKEFALNENDTIALSLISSKLSKTSQYHSISFASTEFDLPKKIIEKWPADKLFPVFDLLRVWALHDESAKEFNKNKDFLNLVFNKALARNGHKQNLKLAIWFLANVVAKDISSKAPGHEQICVQLSKLFSSGNEALALCGLVLNLAIRNQTEPKALLEFIKTGLFPGAPEQTAVSLLIALGILVNHTKRALYGQISEDFFGSLLTGAKFASQDSKNVARELKLLFVDNGIWQ